jgi:hypothetical protein
MSPTNFYFQSGNTSGTTNEQRLIEDLILESISIYGHDVFYLPRTVVKLDNLFLEDVVSQFTQAYPIEMYLANVTGWEGDREVFTKFGIEVRDKATFIVAKRRWEDSVASEAQQLQLPDRPAEGDLLYLPKTDAMFEIKYVEHLDPFFQIGKFYIYSLQCELYQFSSEAIQTGIEEIDDDFRQKSSNVYDYELVSTSGDRILNQAGGAIVLQTFDINNNAPLADNDDFQRDAEEILDFTVINPFGEI